MVGDGRKHVIVHDIPLLGEVMDTIPFVFDAIACVMAPEDLRVRRLVETRGMTEEQAHIRVYVQETRPPGCGMPTLSSTRHSR